MAKFPVDLSDREGIVEGLNYVLSGPSGLGQNFSGFGAFEPATITGNYRSPYTIVPKVTTFGRGQNGSFTITVDDPSLLQEGEYVVGTNITPGTKIAVNGIPTTANKSTITLTAANTGPVSGLINFYSELPAVMYVAPITLSTVEWIDKYTVRCWFASAQPTPPFALGNSPQVRSTSVTTYNQTYRGPGVVECTTTYVVLQSQNENINFGTSLGGNIRFISTNNPPAAGTNPSPDNWIKTDCSIRATVNGNTDRVFLAGQLHNTISYTATASSDLEYTIAINRYLGQPFSDPVNPDYRFLFDGTVTERVYSFPGLTGSGTLPEVETVFATFVDEPGAAYYTYRIEVAYRVTNNTGNLQVTSNEVDLRAISCQVVKQ